MDLHFLSQESARSTVVMGRRRVPSEDPEVRVLLIYTGGTIGMVQHGGGLVPEPGALLKALQKLPFLHDEQYAEDTKLYERYNKDTLVLPKSKQGLRVVYTYLEYSPLLDSSNMTPKEWAKIGKDIEKYYEEYDGFVVLHGTDTMAYTSSALSFMCEHLGKPVIITGSQVPIFEMRSDARDNLVVALLIAGQYPIPEVCLYFHDKLYRGNRATKVDSERFKAFDSPNLLPLGESEVDIKINWEIVKRQTKPGKFTVCTHMNTNVGVLRLFPGITTDTVKAFLQAPMRGVVLETYGCGNAPSNPDLLAEIENATKGGVIIVNCTQCLRGTVIMSYATGQALSKAGVIDGFDMTTEAALSKLAYVLAQHKKLQEKKEMMTTDLRGEMSGEMVTELDGAKLSLSDSRFIQGIAKTLSVGCKEVLEGIQDALMPALACAAAKNGDTKVLEAIRKMGTDLNKADYDGRTPLHIAACQGHLNVVDYLLGKGASVFAKDCFGDTPLHNAILLRHKDAVEVMRKRGAHPPRDKLQDTGTELCRLAASGDLEGLKIWKLAGVDMATSGYDGKTPAEVARAFEHKEVVDFLEAA